MNELIKQSFEEALNINKKESDKLNEASSINTVPGWDSLGHLRLIAALEKRFGIKISVLEAIELINVTEVEKMLKNKGVSLGK